MINITKLSKDPLVAAQESIKIFVTSKVSSSSYKALDPNLRYDYDTALSVITKILKILKKNNLALLIEELTEEQKYFAHVDSLMRTIQTEIENDMADSHFLNQDDIESFDISKLEEEDIQVVRGALEEARKCALTAEFLKGQRKRRIIHFIAKAEQELYREKTRGEIFRSLAYEVSDYVKKFGEDAQPLAESIKTASTRVEQKISSTELIEKEEDPKLLPKPEK